MARVAGWAYISPSIAGATTTGAEVARQAAVIGSPARPPAIAPSHWAVAGATTIASALSATTMWPIRPSGQQAEDVALDRVAAQGRERERGDEPAGGRREQDLDVGALGPEQADELGRLVSRDRAGDPEADEPAAEPIAHASPASSGSPPLTSAWRIARPLSVRSGSIASIPAIWRAQGAADSPPVRIARTSSGGTPLASASSARIRTRSPADERLVAEDRPRAHRADGVAADRPVGRAELDPGQLRGPRGERLEAELETRRDRPADERAVGGDRVERRGGPEVGDDRRRAVQPGGGEGVDEPVGPDLGRTVDPDRDRDVAGAGDEERLAAPGGDGRERVGQRRHDRGAGDRVDPGQLGGVDPEEALEEDLELVGRRPRRRSRARRLPTSSPLRNSPVVTFVLPMSTARSMAG